MQNQMRVNDQLFNRNQIEHPEKKMPNTIVCHELEIGLDNSPWH